MEKKKLFFDMDGVLVDFRSGIDKLSDAAKREFEGHYDDVTGIFALMDPMPGAIEAVHRLKEYYDVYILSTAPWGNPSAWSDKLLWVKKYLGDVFEKRVVLTHCKNLLNCGNGEFLIDDNKKHGASEFGERHIHFGTERFPGWDSVVEFLIAEASMDQVLTGKLKHSLVTESMANRTIKALDAYMKVLNKKCDEDYTQELYKEVMDIASLTNRWLAATGERDKDKYYDI